MKRPIYVRQKENHEPGRPSTFWVNVERGNGKPTFVSETFYDRNGAKRSARSLIGLFDDGLDVVFTYHAGPVGNSEIKTERWIGWRPVEESR